MNDWFKIKKKGKESILVECSTEAYGDVVIPDGVTQIAENAFKDCTKISSLTIPNSVQTIGRNVFDGCSSLITLDLPKASVSVIGGKKFMGRFILTAIE